MFGTATLVAGNQPFSGDLGLPILYKTILLGLQAFYCSEGLYCIFGDLAGENL